LRKGTQIPLTLHHFSHLFILTRLTDVMPQNERTVRLMVFGGKGRNRKHDVHACGFS
jgi:hypothetical protein